MATSFSSSLVAVLLVVQCLAVRQPSKQASTALDARQASVFGFPQSQDASVIPWSILQEDTPVDVEKELQNIGEDSSLVVQHEHLKQASKSMAHVTTSLEPDFAENVFPDTPAVEDGVQNVVQQHGILGSKASTDRKAIDAREQRGAVVVEGPFSKMKPAEIHAAVSEDVAADRYTARAQETLNTTRLVSQIAQAQAREWKEIQEQKQQLLIMKESLDERMHEVELSSSQVPAAPAPSASAAHKAATTTTVVTGTTTIPNISSVNDTVDTSSDFGISANGVGNLPIFLTGIATDVVVFIVCFILFAVLSRAYPIMYLGNAMKYENTPQNVATFSRNGFFNWAFASSQLTLDDVWRVAGLDHAMLLEYTNIGISIFLWIALPMFFILGPMNCFFGGNAAGQDHESWFSMGNVVFYCWLYWPIGLMTWWVAWVTCSNIHLGMQKFMPLRFTWLESMDKIRANTIMMTGIPEQYQSDRAMTDFWNLILPGSVESVNITKDTTLAGNVFQMYFNREDAKSQLKLAEDKWAKDNNDPNKRPHYKLGMFGTEEDAIDHYTKEIGDLEAQLRAGQQEIENMAKESIGSPNLSTGFVTFKERRFAEIALRLDLSNDADEWIMDYPPQPVDVIWADMTQDPNAEIGRCLIGYGLTAGLVIIYMPLVVFICQIATLINLGPLQPIWASEAPSLGLTIMVDFLPTILNLIFTNFFSLYDKAQSQFKLSVWYWWMCVLYVVMITALGTNFLSFAETLSHDPLKVFGLLASTMPECTHYYMNYIGMQCYAHAMVLTRYIMVIKYRLNRNNYSEEESKELAEPEDQDYYGIGSRTCRWSIMMCIGIVYGTLSPPVSMLTLLFFFVVRGIYGYMFVYAETPKTDLGGIFFVRALHNTYISLHIYFVLMIGVFCQRAPNFGPVVLVGMGWAYVFVSQRKFAVYKWERLPYPELFDDHKPEGKKIEGNYVQPEIYVMPTAARG